MLLSRAEASRRSHHPVARAGGELCVDGIPMLRDVGPRLLLRVAVAHRSP
jgi:hypothetical protein